MIVDEEDVVVKVWIDTGFAGARHKDEVRIPRNEWEHMPAWEREEYISDSCMELIWNYISIGWEVTGDDDINA